MPKKKNQETQEEQSERFCQAVRDLVAAGELNPLEADKVLNKVVSTQKPTASRARHG